VTCGFAEARVDSPLDLPRSRRGEPRLYSKMSKDPPLFRIW
jgi:hypothetical protein